LEYEPEEHAMTRQVSRLKSCGFKVFKRNCYNIRKQGKNESFLEQNICRENNGSNYQKQKAGWLTL
jgi:hypothetical protein